MLQFYAATVGSSADKLICRHPNSKPGGFVASCRLIRRQTDLPTPDTWHARKCCRTCRLIRRQTDLPTREQQMSIEANAVRRLIRRQTDLPTQYTAYSVTRDTLVGSSADKLICRHLNVRLL